MYRTNLTFMILFLNLTITVIKKKDLINLTFFISHMHIATILYRNHILFLVHEKFISKIPLSTCEVGFAGWALVAESRGVEGEIGNVPDSTRG